MSGIARRPVNPDARRDSRINQLERRVDRVILILFLTWLSVVIVLLRGVI